DGTNWTALGAGVVGYVSALLALPAGGIVVAGSLTAAGGAATAGIARWDGTSWSSLGSMSLVGPSPNPSPSFYAVAALPNGDLCASVYGAGASFFEGVMRFDGTAWSALGTAFPRAPLALIVSPNGDVIAGGQSVPGGTADTVARWTGSNWAVLAGAPFNHVRDLQQLPNGLLVASGGFMASAAGRVATWDGFVWTPLGDSPASLTPLSLAALASGEVLVAGGFSSIAGVAARGLARWNGVTWSAASSGLASPMAFLAVRPDGSIFVGARYGAVGDSLAHRWNGLSWSPIGAGYPSGPGSGFNLIGLFALPSGDLLAGGNSAWSGTVPTPILQRWTGASWSTIATASYGQLVAAVELPNGDLIVGGVLYNMAGVAVTNVARFDGVNWSPLGAGVPTAVVRLAVSLSGVVHALTAPSVFRWDGLQWTQLGLSQPGTSRALVFGADGAPVLGGSFSNGAEVVRWNGSFWAPLGMGPGGPVQSLAVLPDGDLVAGPLIDGTHLARPLQRWNGAAWTALGGAVNGTVSSLASALNGDLLLSGDFTIADGVPRCYFARVSTSCPASVISVPAGCYYYQSAVLTPNVLPWLGGRCRTTAVGLAAGALALVATGSTALATPLSSLLPVPTYGCQLLVMPDVLELRLPVAGNVSSEFAVPDSVALLGTVVRQQVLPVLLDATGALTGVKASNALVFQIGSF
ncbi:MAG: hypothetical protein ABIP94_25145, partial [Planctomycetota bacterium]